VRAGREIPGARRSRALVPRGLAVALALVASCAAIQPDQPGPPWQSALGLEHPLAGRIWDVAAGRFIGAPALVERLLGARFVLLGEKHDNPDHHRLQAWVLRALIAGGRLPAVGFEMFTVDDAGAIARYRAGRPADAAGLGTAVAWDRTGWPPWPLYQPIADAALAAGLPIVATNLSPATIQALARHGLVALEPSVIARLRLDAPLSPQMRAEMAAEIQESHCHMLPEGMLDNMIAAQRARDAQIAERLAAAAQPNGALVIAGNGHVRKDRGVPAFLALRAPDASAVSLAFLEVQGDEVEAQAYAGYFGRGHFPVDYMWFTPRLDDADPGERYRVPLERLRRGGPK
jgi:uncharacterized iron-regulated protein